MPNVRATNIEDQGVRWVVSAELQRESPPYDWFTYEAQFPRDFGEINPDDVEPVMLQLMLEVAKAQGVYE